MVTAGTVASEDFTIVADSDGIDVSGSAVATIDANSITARAQGIAVSNTAQAYVGDGTLANSNYIDAQITGVSVQDTAYANVDNDDIENTFASGGTGVQLVSGQLTMGGGTYVGDYDTGVEIDAGIASVQNSTIEGQSYGIEVNGSAGLTSIDISNNTNITATDLGGGGLVLLSIPSTTAVTIAGNTIDGADVGVYAYNNAQAITISGGTIENAHDMYGTGYGVVLTNENFVPSVTTATNDESVTLSGVQFLNDDTAILAADYTGSHAVSVGLRSGVTISGGSTGLILDGAKATVIGSTLNNTSFSGFGGALDGAIELFQGALGGVTPGVLDATGATFNGFTPGTTTPTPANLSDFYAVENLITDYVGPHNSGDPSDLNVGYVQLHAGYVFVTQNDETPVVGAIQRGMPGAIQRGVNVANSGNEVDIQAGQFVDNVTIPESLTIIGAGQDSTTVYPATSNPVAGSISGSVVFLIDANNVSIQSLTVDGDNPNLTSGVVVSGADIDATTGIITDWDRPNSYTGMTVKNVTVQNVYLRGIEYADGNDFGTGTTDFEDDTVTNVQGDPENSIAIFSFGGNGTIASNIVSHTPDAISTNWSYGTEISGNTITHSLTGIHSDNNGGAGGSADSIHDNNVSLGGAGSYGIFVFAPYESNTSVHHNTISGVDTGLGALGGFGGSVAFSNNPVSVNAGGTGALVTTDLGVLFGQANVLASFNGDSFTGGATGILVQQNVGATASASISNVTIDDPAIGIDVNAGSATISGNHIYDNTIGIRFTNGGSGSVTGNDFNYAGSTANGTDLRLDSDAGLVTGGTLTGNTFAGTTYIDNRSPQNLTALATPAGTNIYMRDDATVETDNFAIRNRIFDKIDSASSGLVTWVANNIYVTPIASATATDNDYTRLANAIAATVSGDTVNLQGTFDWTEARAAASWALGNDGISQGGGGDDYTLSVPGGLNNVIFTAPGGLGTATIQGPGDLPGISGEFLQFYTPSQNTTNQNWTISNLEINDFSVSILMYFGQNDQQFSGTHIVGNHIVVPQNSAADGYQNQAIDYSFGTNQVIQNNIIDLQGGGASDSAHGNYAAEDGLESNTSGGDVYDGLLIDGNTINVMQAQSADPEVIIGIWENGWANSSNITVSNNHFYNLAAGNNPTLNLERAYRVTSQSSATTTVTYSGNTSDGANIGFQWDSDNHSGTPVVMTNNTVTNARTGVLIQVGGAAATMSGNTFTNSGPMSGVGTAISVSTGASVTLDGSLHTNSISGFATGVLDDGSAVIENNTGSIFGNAIGIDVEGGSATISGNHIYDNTTGVKVGGGTASIDSNDFTGTTSNGTDLLVTGGTVNSLTNNQFAAATTYIDNETSQPIDATTDSFNVGSLGSQVAAIALLAGDGSAYSVEDKITDYLDYPSLGYVELQPTNVFVAQSSETATLASIQRGINVAPSAGTVYVEGGLMPYVGDLTIGESLTLSGAEAGVDPGATGWTGSISTIMGAGITAPIAISSGTDSVTIDGFAIESPNTGSGSDNAGIFVSSSGRYRGRL